jgi:hypothetical protein
VRHAAHRRPSSRIEASGHAGATHTVNRSALVLAATLAHRFRRHAPAGLLPREDWNLRHTVCTPHPPRIIGTAIVGGVGGGIWGKVRDKGFRDEDLKAIGESLEPGTSAIIAIAEDRVIERLQRGLEGYQNIARHAVSAEAAVQIMAEVEEISPVQAEGTGGEASPAG